MFRGTYVVVSSVLRTRTYSSFKFSHPSYTSMVHYTTNISDEVTKARSTKNRPVVTIFDQIINKELSANIIYEDDKCMAFTDVNPQAPTHILVIPKRRISMLSQAKDADKELLGHLLLVARQVGNENTTNGYRIVINDGPDGCQSIYYLHLHVLGGRQMNWPPG